MAPLFAPMLVISSRPARAGHRSSARSPARILDILSHCRNCRYDLRSPPHHRVGSRCRIACGIRRPYPFGQAVELSGWRVRPGRAADRFPAKAAVPRLRPAGPSRLWRTVTMAYREFRKIIESGVHVTPRIELNPVTACTRIATRRFSESARGTKKQNIYSWLQSIKQPSYWVEMHNCVGGLGSRLRRP